MYEYKSDMETALHALQDEVKGVEEYKWMMENCQDPELKAIAQKIMADEKKHAIILMQWSTNNIQKALAG